ncbi:LD-carboxypeptidase [Lentisphaerota bacterium ZTH]|nr:LD-carboxypeptidase [Lentisphaerota bacterium]WET07702.1 LD-carboxypeptidase [Lentisphaerota bacterium ZTH]
MKKILPDNIQHVAIIAPAGPVKTDALDVGVDILHRQGLKVSVMPNVKTGSEVSYLSADIDKRLSDLHACWQDKSIDLVLCARGGFGSVQLLPEIDWELMRSRPLPLIGYSDITALHAGMLKHNAGIPIAAPMPLRYQQAFFDCNHADFTLKYLYAAFQADQEYQLKLPESMPAYEFIKDGKATALPFTANLAVLVTLCGTPWFPDLDKRILIVEDINEPAYKIDRYLTQLEHNGVLGKLSGLFFGSFTACSSKQDLNLIIKKFAASINGPVLKNFPFGHTFPLLSINMTRTMTVDSKTRLVTV